MNVLSAPILLPLFSFAISQESIYSGGCLSLSLSKKKTALELFSSGWDLPWGHSWFLRPCNPAQSPLLHLISFSANLNYLVGEGGGVWARGPEGSEVTRHGATHLYLFSCTEQLKKWLSQSVSESLRVVQRQGHQGSPVPCQIASIWRGVFYSVVLPSIWNNYTHFFGHMAGVFFYSVVFHFFD